jgi:Zn-dependent metalloprotease
VNAENLFVDHARLFQLTPGNEMVAPPPERDELGVTHFRFQQLFRGIRVENAVFLVRATNNRALSANGVLAYDFQPATTTPKISEAGAWSTARLRIPSVRYLRGDNLVDDLANPDGVPAGHRPPGELIFTEDPARSGGERLLAWRFKIYVSPASQSRQVYINAADGSVIKELPLFPACELGSGPVTFRGTRAINTQKKGNKFYLVDDCDGTLLSAWLLDNTNKTVVISDDDNNWAGNNPSLVTSYWGLRASYDYFNLIHGRSSYDGKNGKMSIFNDPTTNTPNANGGGGSIHIGLAGPGDNDDFNCLDIIGHEFTHSLIEQTAGLAYTVTNESAALNESFCDIFGQMVEQWLEGGTQKEWIIGDDRGCGLCRDFVNPKSRGNPDTYQGINWLSGTNAEPHNNGCVQDRWFALLCDGGSGVNAETGSGYNVSGIGMAKARKIAYRTLTRYLTPTSGFVDARQGSIDAATDYYGDNSREVDSVVNAWCAVGLCGYVIPSTADRFDIPGGNPNPVSPNNNNSLAGATPLGTGSRLLGTGIPWSKGNSPRLRLSNLSIFPANDVDYFNLSFPQLNAPGGRCFTPGYAFDFGTKVNARIFVNGVLWKSYVNVQYFSLPVGKDPQPIVLQISAPFPGQILTYQLSIAFFLHFDSSCYQTTPPDLWKQIENCPMCDLQLLKGVDRVILEPLYRQPNNVEIQDRYFLWNGEGALQVPVSVLQGNSLHVELVNQDGQTVATADRAGENDLLLKVREARAGVYSLRFSGFGNGTEILVRTPRR